MDVFRQSCICLRFIRSLSLCPPQFFLPHFICGAFIFMFCFAAYWIFPAGKSAQAGEFFAGSSVAEAKTETAAMPAVSSAAAPEPQSCATVHLAETGWTDITAATAVAAQILRALGYEAQTKFLSVPIVFSAMSTGEIDAFLGFWRPTMAADIKPYLESGAIELAGDNLRGARYGLAVLRPLADAGLRSTADIARFADALDYKIYGIEPGNDANRIILTMIEDNAEGLGQFRLVESSERAMLAEVEAAAEEKSPIVFLAWQPHPMNQKLDIVYLTGGEAYFGAEGNGARVSTVLRKNYGAQCPNIARFLRNLVFTLEQENSLMDKILTKGVNPDAAARSFLHENPDILRHWLQGVKTRTGKDAESLAQILFPAE